MKIIEFDQNKLSSECWSVQFQGLEACENCSLRDTNECGGRLIRRFGVNKKGYKIPISEVVLNHEH